MEERLILGCIADDFTGASDAASFLVKGGMKTVLFSGVPKEGVDLEGCQAAVIALKTRTQETEKAVADTLKAAAWLKAKGVQQLYIKYCSTFDSTRKGNIGPIMDCLLNEYRVPYTILCPALPVNGRTVSEGRLYVNGVPLDESPMKDHPLTPMWDSRISELMRPQSKYPCILPGEEAPETEHYYVIPDYVEDADAAKIAAAYGELELLSGGSGILTELAKFHMGGQDQPKGETMAAKGAALLLAGSCSEATREQIRYFQNTGRKSMKMEPVKLLDGTQDIEMLWRFIEMNQDQEVLIYSSDDPDAVKKVQENGKDKVAALLESTTAKLARRAVETGYTRIIVAGGETSGAVTKGLGFDSYLIGDSVAPGVPVMIPKNQKKIRLVLKSGNFGQEDFFVKALDMTRSE